MTPQQIPPAQDVLRDYRRTTMTDSEKLIRLETDGLLSRGILRAERLVVDLVKAKTLLENDLDARKALQMLVRVSIPYLVETNNALKDCLSRLETE